MNSSEVSGPGHQMPYAVVLGSIICIGFPLNAIAIWILLRHHSLKSSNVIFMVNLAISDLLLVSSLPLKVCFYATGNWPFGHITKILAKALFSANIRCSSIFITLISVDRLLAIVYPLRFRHIRTASNARKAVVIVWLFVIIVCIIRNVRYNQYLKPHNESLSIKHPHRLKDKVKLKYVEGIFQLTVVLFLLIVNIVSTVLVTLTLRRNVKDLSKINNKVNVLVLFVFNLVMFIVCFVPVSIRYFTMNNHAVLKCLGSVNCCLDPVLYYFSMDAFWKKKEERNQLKPRNVI